VDQSRPKRKGMSSSQSDETDWDCQAPRFRVNQPVYVDLGSGPEGPCVVVKVNINLTPPTYLLETEDGNAINEGREVEQARLSGKP